MSDVDNDVVERVLGRMRSSTMGTFDWLIEDKSLHGEPISDEESDILDESYIDLLVEALELVAHRPSLFRAVELRRAELQRAEVMPGGKASE